MTAASPLVRSAALGAGTSWMPPNIGPRTGLPEPTGYCVMSLPLLMPRRLVTASDPSSSTATSVGHHDVGSFPAAANVGGVVLVSTVHAATALSPASVA